jgi:hypothetical protein
MIPSSPAGSPTGESWVTIPLKRKGLGAQKIKDLQIYEKARWKKKFLGGLQHFYARSLYYEPVVEEIRSALDKPGTGFLDLALSLLNILRSRLGIDKEMSLQSEFGITGRGTPLLVSAATKLGADEVILPGGSEKAVNLSSFEKSGIKVRFLRFTSLPYAQFWGDFLPHLSALDILLCCGPNGRQVIEKGTRISESAQ